MDREFERGVTAITPYVKKLLARIEQVESALRFYANSTKWKWKRSDE